MGERNGSNRILDRLGPGSRTAVLRACEFVRLENGSVVVAVGQEIGAVDFVETGFLSVVADDERSGGVEIGLIGREGMSGSWVALGRAAAPFRIVVQGSGTALRMSGDAFRRACLDYPDLQQAVLSYAHDFTTTVAETCRANTRLTVEGRLARWLLMAHDRVDTDELFVTHDTLSKMLGVRRPGVTVALHVLEGEHMVKAKRGTIRIVDREKLGAAARGFYRSAPTAEPAMTPSVSPRAA